MRISVVVPAYNSGPYLERALRSVLDQTAADWELIVVDDGSDDGTEDVARRYAARDPRLRVVRQPNAGIAAARNRGLAETDRSYEAVAFLDHDDEWEDDALATMSAGLDACPAAAAVAGLARCIDSRSRPSRLGDIESWGRHRRGVVGGALVNWPLTSPTSLAVLAYRNCIATSGLVLARRSALEEAGPFDPAASPCDDWDMWLRLSQIGDIAFINAVLLAWRAHPGNTSSKHELVASKQRYVRRKLLSSTLLTEDQRRVADTANWFWGRRVCSTWLSLAIYSAARGESRRAARQWRRAAVSYIQWRCGIPLP